MQKSKLDKFISKYNLGGNVNSVKWKSSGDSLSTSFVTPDKSLLGIIIGEVSNKRTVVDLNPILSTIPWNWPGTSILCPGWNLFSPIINIPDIRFLNKSCAPKAIATEKSPSPAIRGPISIPKMSRIIAKPITQTNTLVDLSNHTDMAWVNQVLLDKTENKGRTKLERALKIV